MTAADPRAIAALDAHLAYVEHLSLAGGAPAVRDQGVLLFSSPASLPTLVNGAARVDRAVPPGSVIQRATTFFREAGFELLCLDGRDDDLREAAVAAGFSTGSTDPLLHLDRPLAPSLPSAASIEMRLVTDASGVRDVASVNADAGAVYDFPPGFFTTIFARPETVLDTKIQAVVGYEEGEPVATAQVFLHSGLAYVGWVAVARRAMRRGFGRLVTAEVVTRGFRAGARASVLMASPMGAPLYRRMGFVDVGLLRDAYAAPARQPSEA